MRMTLLKGNRLKLYKPEFMYLFILLLLIPHFEPNYFDAKVPFMDLLFNAGRVVSACFILAYALFIRRRTSKLFLVLLVYQAWQFANTVLQVGLTKYIIISTLSMLIACLIIDCYAQSDMKHLIHALTILYELLIYINFISVLLFPDGMYATEWSTAYYFIGYRNSLTFIFIPGLVVSMIWQRYRRNPVRLLMLLLTCMVSALLSKSATCLVVMVFMLVAYFFGFYKWRVVKPYTVTLAYIVAFFAVVLFRVLDYAASLLSTLERSVTLTGRVFIWDKTIEMISKRPLIGYGIQSGVYRASLVRDAYAAINAHDFILEHLYVGGIIQLLIIVIFFGMILKRMKRNENLTIVQYMTLGLACIFLFFIVEASSQVSLYTFFFLCFYSGSFRSVRTKRQYSYSGLELNVV